MAHHLESLASHYDQMAEALREGEAGEVFSEEDLQSSSPWYFNSLFCLTSLFPFYFNFRHEQRYQRTTINYGGAGRRCEFYRNLLVSVSGHVAFLRLLILWNKRATSSKQSCDRETSRCSAKYVGWSWCIRGDHDRNDFSSTDRWGTYFIFIDFYLTLRISYWNTDRLRRAFNRTSATPTYTGRIIKSILELSICVQ